MGKQFQVNTNLDLCNGCQQTVYWATSHRTGKRYRCRVTQSGNNFFTDRTDFHNCPAGTAPAPVALSDFANLYGMFEYAVSQNLKFPKIRFAYQNQTIIVKRAGAKSKYTGQIQITNDAGYGSFNNRYYGRITSDGMLHAGGDMTPEIEALIKEFAADPLTVAQRYGQLTGNCMFCGKFLDDPISTACGYGPVCAKKWNLPHNAARQSRMASKAAAVMAVAA